MQQRPANSIFSICSSEILLCFLAFFMLFSPFLFNFAAAQPSAASTITTRGACSPGVAAGRDASVTLVCGMTPQQVGLAIAAAIGQPIVAEIEDGPACSPEVRAGRNAIVSIVCGIRPEDLGLAVAAATEQVRAEFDRFRQDAGLTESAARRILGIVGEADVPAGDLPTQLAAAVGRFHEVLERLRTYESDDPEVSSLIGAAERALEDGKFNEADEQLILAEDRQARIVALRQEALERSKLRQSSLRENRANIFMLRYDFVQAARAFLNASELLPDGAYDQKSRILFLAANAFYDISMFADAAEIAQHSFTLREQQFGLAHVKTIESANLFAAILIRLRRFEESESLLLRVLANSRSQFGDDDCVVCSLVQLGATLTEAGELQRADTMLQEARAIIDRRPDAGTATATVAALLSAQSDLYVRMGRYIEAEKFGLDLWNILEQSTSTETPRGANALGLLAVISYRLGREIEAEQLLRRSLALLESFPAQDLNEIARILASLGVVVRDHSERILIQRRSLDIFGRLHGSRSEQAILPLHNLGAALYAVDNYIEAESFQRRALDIAVRIYPDNDDRMRSIVRNLRNTLDALERPADADDLMDRFPWAFDEPPMPIIELDPQQIPSTKPDALP